MRTITHSQTELVERPVPREWHAGCGKRPDETARSKDETALRADFTTGCSPGSASTGADGHSPPTE